MQIKYKVGIIKKSRYLDGTWNFQYVTQNMDGKDQTVYGGVEDQNKSNYPEGTIFLDSSFDDIYGYTTLQNIIINSEGPSIVDDKTTRQVLNVGGKENPTPIKVKLIFKSKSPLDIMELEAVCGDITLIKIHRKNNQVEINQLVSNINLDKNNDIYTLSFDLNPYANESLIGSTFIKALNDNEITIKVFDINANGVEYTTYGEPWKYIDTEEEIFDLEKLVIRFSDIIPEDMIIAPNIEGECTVTVFNPNSYLWNIKPIIQLNEESIGKIIGDIDFSDYVEHGIAKFKVKRIVEYGNVIVDAWIDLQNPKIHDIVYNATYAQGILGPWLVEDERNRKIKMLDYTPAYMHDREYFEFVKFTEKFLNTMYMSMSKKASIGILEKVARIADFNYINDVEAKLLNHYKEHFGIELDPNVDDLRNFLLQKKIALTNEEGEIVGNADAYEDLTGKELDNFIRYVYHEIPEYNQYKGSYKGVKMALNMLGLCCKLVELWSKVDDKQKDDLRRADEISDFFMKKIDENGNEVTRTTKAAVAKLFLTSRFDVDIEEPSITFREFNGLADNICRLIFQCKPVTRLLRKLSYIYYIWSGLKFSYLWFPFYNTQQIHHFKYIFPLASDYVKTKHKFISTLPNDYDPNVPSQGMFIEFDKLFINHVANEAYVTYLQNETEKKWKEGTFTNDDLITRTAIKNAYCNLRNIAYCAKLSTIQKLQFKIDYCYVCKKDIKEDENSVTENRWEYHYTKDTYIKYVDETKYELVKEDPLKYNFPLYNWVEGPHGDPTNTQTMTIDEAKNGFYLSFNKSLNGLFNNKPIMPEFFINGVNNEFKRQHGSGDLIENYRYVLHNMDLEIDFDIALGTNFIAQHYVGEIEYPIEEGPQISYDERSYEILETDLYKPPVWETVWLNAGWGTVYYLLKKGKSADRLNRDNWLMITDRAINGYKMHLDDPNNKLNDVIPITEDVELDENGHPIIIFEHTGLIDYDDGYPYGFIHIDTSAYNGKGSTFAFSDEDDLENPQIFKLLEEVRNKKGHIMIYRISDMAQRAEFGLQRADGEFAIMLEN